MRSHVSPRSSVVSAQSGNRVLARLSEEEQRRLSPVLRSTLLKTKQMLLRQGEPIQEVTFLDRGVCSLVKVMEDGSSIEIMALGREAIVGASVGVGQAESVADVIVEIGGEAQALPVSAFRGEVDRGGTFCDYVRGYQAALTTHLVQVVACNALHSAEQRCCRWLLTTQHHMQRDEFPMTHEMLAGALGVRRPTVTLVMAGLSRAGVIRHGRGWVTVRNRPALEAMSCECYRVVAAAPQRM